MIRLAASPYKDLFAFTLTRYGIPLFITDDAIDPAERMVELGIDNPHALIDAARQWGAVEIRDVANDA